MEVPFGKSKLASTPSLPRHPNWRLDCVGDYFVTVGASSARSPDCLTARSEAGHRHVEPSLPPVH